MANSKTVVLLKRRAKWEDPSGWGLNYMYMYMYIFSIYIVEFGNGMGGMHDIFYPIGRNK